jgi:hypothetical protein
VALADAILEIIAHRAHYVRPRADIAALFSTERTVIEYERLFRQLGVAS